MKRPDPAKSAAAPADTLRARLVRPGIIAVGEYQAGREHDLTPEEFERLAPRGFVRVDPPAAAAEPDPAPAPAPALETQPEEQSQ